VLSITESTTVRELLSLHPETFEVLLRHGMCADCQADPPEVPLGHFATKHCGGDYAGLRDELRRAVVPAAGQAES